MPSKSVWIFTAAMLLPLIALTVLVYRRSAPTPTEGGRIFPAQAPSADLKRASPGEPPADSALLSPSTNSVSSLQYLRSTRSPSAAAAEPAPVSNSTAAAKIPAPPPAGPQVQAKAPPEGEPASTPKKLRPMNNDKHSDISKHFKQASFTTRTKTLFKPKNQLTNSVIQDPQGSPASK